MDHATVVSLVPRDIHEEKPGIYPGVFKIPACNGPSPNILNVEPSIYYFFVGEGRGDYGQFRDQIKRTIPAEEIARSIVDDYLDGQLARTQGSNEPALFWVPGKLSVVDVITKHKEEIKNSLQKQHNWFVALVTLADDDWEKHRQHKIITDLQRMAAISLGLDRPWIVAAKEQEIKKVKCPVCKTMIEQDAIICSTCKLVIDPEKYKNLQFAGVTK